MSQEPCLYIAKLAGLILRKLSKPMLTNFSLLVVTIRHNNLTSKKLCFLSVLKLDQEEGFEQKGPSAIQQV